MSTQLVLFFEKLFQVIDWKTMFAMLTGGLIPLFIARHMFKKHNEAARLKESRDACIVLIKEFGEIQLLLLQTMNKLGSLDGKQSDRIGVLRDKIVALENQIMICRLISTENIPEQLLLKLATSIQEIHNAIDALELYKPASQVHWMEKHGPSVGDACLLLNRLVFQITECFRPVDNKLIRPDTNN